MPSWTGAKKSGAGLDLMTGADASSAIADEREEDDSTREAVQRNAVTRPFLSVKVRRASSAHLATATMHS
jgi:hypothetical protein